MDSTFVKIACDSVPGYDTTYVHDHDFDTDNEGWGGFNCPSVSQNGKLLLDKCISQNGLFYQNFNRIDGKDYYYEFDFEEGDCGGLDSISFVIGGKTNGDYYLNLSGNGFYSGNITASGSGNAVIWFVLWGTDTCDAYVDNFKFYTLEDTMYWQCDSIYEKFGQSAHRYLFNAMENDPEVSGLGNSYTTQFRQYDPRLGRWKSLDPLMMKFPDQSPYNGFGNNPIFFVDPYGLEPSSGDDGGGDGGGGDDLVFEGGCFEEVEIFEEIQPKSTPKGNTPANWSNFSVSQKVLYNQRMTPSHDKGLSGSNLRGLYSAIDAGKDVRDSPSNHFDGFSESYDKGYMGMSENQKGYMKFAAYPIGFTLVAVSAPGILLEGGGTFTVSSTVSRIMVTGTVRVGRFLWKGGLWSGGTNVAMQLSLKNPEEFNVTEAVGTTMGGYWGAGVASFLDWRPFSDDQKSRSFNFTWNKGQTITQIGSNFTISFATSRIGNLKNVNGAPKSFLEKVIIESFSTTIGTGVSYSVTSGPLRGF